MTIETTFLSVSWRGLEPKSVNTVLYSIYVHISMRSCIDSFWGGAGCSGFSRLAEGFIQAGGAPQASGLSSLSVCAGKACVQLNNLMGWLPSARSAPLQIRVRASLGGGVLQPIIVSLRVRGCRRGRLKGIVPYCNLTNPTSANRPERGFKLGVVLDQGTPPCWRTASFPHL